MSDFELGAELVPVNPSNLPVVNDQEKVTQAIVWGLEHNPIVMETVLEATNYWNEVGSSLWAHETSSGIHIREVGLDGDALDATRVIQAVQTAARDSVKARLDPQKAMAKVRRLAFRHQQVNAMDAGGELLFKGTIGYIASAGVVEPFLKDEFAIQDPIYAFIPAALWIGKTVYDGIVDGIDLFRADKGRKTALQRSLALNPTAETWYGTLRPALDQILQSFPESDTTEIRIQKRKYKIREKTLKTELNENNDFADFNHSAIIEAMKLRIKNTGDKDSVVYISRPATFISDALSTLKGTSWRSALIEQVRIIAKAQSEISIVERDLKKLEANGSLGITAETSEQSYEDTLERAKSSMVLAMLRIAVMQLQHEAGRVYGEPSNAEIAENQSLPESTTGWVQPAWINPPVR